MANCSKPSNGKICGKFGKRRSVSVPFVGALLSSMLVFSTMIFAEERPGRQNGANAAAVEETFQDAVKRIPWDSLSPAIKSKIKPVISGHSIFRRMPQQAVYADPEIYQFLVEHPDVVVGFWEKLGVTQVSLRELSDGRFLMKETAGTTAVGEVLYQTRDVCIVHAKGQYKGTLFPRTIDGEAVLVLRSRFLRDEDNEPYVLSQLDSFVRIENVGADLVAKLLSNVLGKIADSNFEQTIGFVGNVSDAAANNTKRVKDMSSGMKGVRKTVREDFSDVVDRVVIRSAKRGNRVFPEYVMAELPIVAEPGEPSPFASYSVPMPIIAREVRPDHSVRQTVERDEKPQTEEVDVPIPIGYSTLESGPVEPPKSRVIFRRPNITATETSSNE